MGEAVILYTAARYAKNTALHPGFIHASKHTTFFVSASYNANMQIDLTTYPGFAALPPPYLRVNI